MSGICGVVIREPDDRLCRSSLESITRAMRGSGRGPESMVTFETAGIGTQGGPDRLSAVAQTTVQGRAVALAFHGNLYGEAGTVDGLLDRYVRQGIGFIQGLRGDFALAIWHAPHTLYVATDRFRVHPIFYYEDDEKLLFASTMRGILGCGLKARVSLDLEALADFVVSSSIPTPKTIFRQVRKIPPAHVLEYDNGRIGLKPYWEIDFRRPDRGGEKALSEKLRRELDDAVRLRLGAENRAARVGTFLSGGVDSSTVTGLVARMKSESLKAFSVGFQEQAFNEIGYARDAARWFGVEHVERVVTARDTYDILPLLVESFDEPFGNASAVPTYFCARMAREHGIDVLYAGDGGDELFAGNERYASQRVFDAYGRIPRIVRTRALEPLVAVGAAHLRSELFTKARKYIRRASIPYPDRLWSYGLVAELPLRALFEDGVLDEIGWEYDPYQAIARHHRHAPARTELDRQLYLDLNLAISDNDLFKVNRMTEVANVAVRYPFLDHVLAEFAASVPSEIRMRGRNLRSFFKRAYRDFLPPQTLAKKKHGFGLPIAGWLRSDPRLNAMMHDLVLGSGMAQRGYFRRGALEELVGRHRADEGSLYGTTMWNLMTLELWLRRHVGA